LRAWPQDMRFNFLISSFIGGLAALNMHIRSSLLDGLDTVINHTLMASQDQLKDACVEDTMLSDICQVARWPRSACSISHKVLAQLFDILHRPFGDGITLQ